VREFGVAPVARRSRGRERGAQRVAVEARTPQAQQREHRHQHGDEDGVGDGVKVTGSPPTPSLISTTRSAPLTLVNRLHRCLDGERKLRCVHRLPGCMRTTPLAPPRTVPNYAPHRTPARPRLRPWSPTLAAPPSPPRTRRPRPACPCSRRSTEKPANRGAPLLRHVLLSLAPRLQRPYDGLARPSGAQLLLVQVVVPGEAPSLEPNHALPLLRHVIVRRAPGLQRVHDGLQRRAA